MYWQQNPRCTWEEIEAAAEVTIPGNFKLDGPKVLSIGPGSSFATWADWYKTSVVSRLESILDSEKTSAFQAPKAEVSTVKEIKSLTRVGEFTLKPAQEAVFEAVIRDFYGLKLHKAALQDGRTGSGKTVFAMAYLDYVIRSGLLDGTGPLGGMYMTPIMIFCPPGLMEVWYRHIERAGLGSKIGNTIEVIPYSGLSATQGQIYLTEKIEYDAYTNQEKTVYQWNPAYRPFTAIFDECHRLKNDSFQTKAILALLKHELYSIWMSATPFVTVNDTKAFVLATKARLLDMQVTEKNFNIFAGLICNEPHKPNLAAAKRLRKVLAPYIYSMPPARWDHKAINVAILVNFSSQKDAARYDELYNVYLDKCRLLGKNTDFGRFEQFVALGQFRKGVEPMRMDAIVDRCHKHIVDGDASPVIGMAYRDSLIRAAFRLKMLGYKRSDISVIWGGKEELKTKYILSEAEFNEIFQKSIRGEELTKLDLKRIQITLQFKEEKAAYQEKKDEETYRRLEALGEFGLLGNQSPNQRQIEIDRFQNGESKICLFTLAAGGTGLSLDHWHPKLKPRVGYFTPIYSGPEFQQALGRLVRLMTLSDTRQYIVGMAGTVEESHVMPLIDSKLRCIAEITNSDYSIIDFHKAQVVQLAKIRDENQAVVDSEDEKTQLYNVGDSPETDEDDDSSIE